MNDQDSELVEFTLRLDRATWKQLGHLAAEEGVSKSQIIRDAVDKLLGRQPKVNKK